MRTNLIVTKIKSLEKDIEELKKGLEFIYLHPNLSYDKMGKIETKLSQNGWVVINKMVPYESYHGFGTTLTKAKEELNDFDKKFLSKHEYGYVYS